MEQCVRRNAQKHYRQYSSRILSLAGRIGTSIERNLGTFWLVELILIGESTVRELEVMTIFLF